MLCLSHNEQASINQAAKLGYSPLKAWMGAVLSVASYKDVETATQLVRQHGLHLPGQPILLQRRNTCALVYVAADRLIIAFRGTEDFHDLLDDLDAKPIRLRCGVRVHKGFYRYTRRLWPELHDIITTALRSTYYPMAVQLYGHSLGGAAAVLTAHWLLRYGSEVEVQSVYVYGCPKVGDKRFRLHYRQRGLEQVTWSHVNNNDPICWLPITCGYRAVTRQHLIYYTYNRDVLLNPSLVTMLRDRRRGATKALAQLVSQTVMGLYWNQHRLSRAIIEAFAKQLDQFDHRVTQYLSLAERSLAQERCLNAKLV